MSPLVIGEFIGAYEIVGTLGAGGMGDLAQVKEAYRADHLVATTITKKAKRLVLNVQLVDTRTWKVRWGHQYEGAQADYNDLVRDAAEAVARTLAREAQGYRITLSLVDAQGRSRGGKVLLVAAEDLHDVHRSIAAYLADQAAQEPRPAAAR